MDLDRMLATLRSGSCITEAELKRLCVLVKNILVEESNVQPVQAPVTICGDIHGQFYDLLELFRTGGELPQTNYIFMGDYVDRGHNSVETLQYLLCLKARYPDNITLLRGNHESRQITQVYGFYEECVRKYGNPNPWKYCVEVFDYMNLAAIVNGSVLCVHGGISPYLATIDQIQTIERVQEIPHEGGYCDLMWSDPEDMLNWALNPRGAGYLFGSKVTKEFNHTNGLELICRAHQLVMEGYKYHFPDKNLVTEWSAPNYCYRSGNVASILALNEHMAREFKLFNNVAEPSDSPDVMRRSQIPYFL
jgi:serine/threonine-protein phosphatase 6 catalytic subunit